ncbi:hypothetical protein AB0L71_10380 [Streptomyces sp. NPDC052052]|uniref:hypothetical protein n=1 Tax=Streptomyces sp. NPDC052052 TaxID=3154756 RepID=UPI003433D5C2
MVPTRGERELQARPMLLSGPQLKRGRRPRGEQRHRLQIPSGHGDPVAVEPSSLTRRPSSHASESILPASAYPSRKQAAAPFVPCVRDLPQ